jgi:hypothetical protein
MKRIELFLLACLFGYMALAVPARAQGAAEKIAAAKQAAAQNQVALRAYKWVEKTEISLKGEVKNTSLNSCVYGSDGKVLKTPLSTGEEKKDSPPPGRRARKGGPIKARVVEKKTGELKAEMQAASALVHHYVPPAPDKMQAAMAAGRVTITPGAGITALRIADYEKRGDSMVITLDSAAKALQQIAVDTWLDDPAQKVRLDVQMQSLPDGTSYPGRVVLAIPSSNLQVQITNSDYQKLAN